MSFAEKVVIITGAGQGIGEEYAKRCAAEGLTVVVAEINEEQGQRVADEINASNGKAVFVKTDVSDAASVQAMVDATSNAYGRIDYLVNNAALFGQMKSEPLVSVDMDYFDKFMNINFRASLVTARAVMPHMQKQGGGAIVNQSSTAAWMHIGYYSLAKHALNGLTCCLARELGPMNIRINAIAPGPTDTQALRTQAGDYADQLTQSMPISRLGQPDDLAGALIFLLSDEAKWMTGHILNVDGGQEMRV